MTKKPGKPLKNSNKTVPVDEGALCLVPGVERSYPGGFHILERINRCDEPFGDRGVLRELFVKLDRDESPVVSVMQVK